MQEEYTLIDFIEDYEKRKGLKEEEEIFFYLDYAIRDENFNAVTFVRKNDAKDRLDRIKNVLKETEDEVIDSNIYLKKCKEFLTSTKENTADLLLEHQAKNNNRVSIEVSTEELLPTIDEPELLGLDIVKNYNEVADKVEKMYAEINRLNVWFLINQDKDCDDDIATITLKNNNGTTGILTALFQDNAKKNPYLGYVKKSGK